MGERTAESEAAYREGFDAGRREGLDAGRQQGFLNGHRAGFLEGHRTGWEQGLLEARGGAAPGSNPQIAHPPAMLIASALPVAPASPAVPTPIVPPTQGAASADLTAPVPPAGPVPPSSLPAGPPSFRSASVRAAEEEFAARRHRRVVQNVNVALYAASLLIVAAATLFLASTAAESIRLAGLAIVTALFYGAGLAIHSRIPRLRPAAVAFTGTGLALMPVTGLAFDLILVHQPALTWLVTSLSGFVAFAFAAVRLESRILVYLTLTFAFSAAWSGASVLGGALALDFAAVLLVSAFLGLVVVLRPRWIPPIMLRPIARLHPYVAPATFCAATLAAGSLERWQYPSLVAAMCAYFAVAAAVRGSLVIRRGSWWAARTTAVIAAGTAFGQAAGAGLFGPAVRGADVGIIAASAMIAAQIVGTALAERKIRATFRLSARAIFIEQASAVALHAVLAVILAAVGFVESRPESDVIVVVLALLVLSAHCLAWWQGRPGEAVVAVALGFVVVLRPSVSAGGFAVLVGWGMVYWLVRAVQGAARGPGWTRAEYLAAARLVSLVVTPAVVDAVLPDGVSDGARLAALAAAVSGSAGFQLVLSAILAWFSRPEFARGVVVSVLATACGAAAWVSFMGSEPGVPSIPATASASVAAVALSAALFPKTEPLVGGTSRPVGVGELVPPLLLAGVSVGAFAADRSVLGEITLAILCAVLASCALRTRPRVRRWAYVWLARAVATALALALFHTIESEGGPVWIFGQPITIWHVLAASLLVQLPFPLVAEIRGARDDAGFPWALEDAAVVLGLGVVSIAALLPSYVWGAPGPVTGFLVTAAAGGTAAVGMVLRRRAGSIAVAPLGLISTGLLAGGNLRLLEILIGLFAVYAAAMVYLARGRVAKGAHLVAARVLPLALAALVAHDATASVTVVSLVLAGGLAAQHVVRRILQRSAAKLPFVEAAYWSGLAAQVALPTVYALSARSEVIGGRWVLVVESLLALASVFATLRAHRRAGYAGLVAGLLALAWLGPGMSFPSGQFLSAPILSGTALALVFAAVSVVHVIGMVRWEHGQMTFQWPWTVGAGALGAASALVGFAEPPWVFGAGLASCAAALIVASLTWHYERVIVGATFPLGVLAAMSAGISVGRSVFEGESGPWNEAMPVLVGGLVPTGVGVALRWASVWARDEANGTPSRVGWGTDPLRRWALVGGGGLALALAMRVSWEPPVVVVLPGLAAALAGLVVGELEPTRRRVGIELGCLFAAAALQRSLFADRDDVSVFWLAQWYVVLAGVLALLRYLGGSRVVGRRWLTGSTSLASLGALLVLFSADAAQQTWLLVVFSVFTAAGVLTAERRFTVWGAAGVLACVLWAVRAYPYLLLAVLGLALIGAAVWWLVRSPRGTLLP